jgi:hypothetical protein
MSDDVAIVVAMVVFGGLAYACIGLVLLAGPPLAAAYEAIRAGMRRLK